MNSTCKNLPKTRLGTKFSLVCDTPLLDWWTTNQLSPGKSDAKPALLIWGSGIYTDYWKHWGQCCPGESVLIAAPFLTSLKKSKYCDPCWSYGLENQKYLGRSPLATGHSEQGSTSVRDKRWFSVGQRGSCSKDHFPIRHFSGNDECGGSNQIAVEQVRIPFVWNNRRKNKGSCQLGGYIET